MYSLISIAFGIAFGATGRESAGLNESWQWNWGHPWFLFLGLLPILLALYFLLKKRSVGHPLLLNFSNSRAVLRRQRLKTKWAFRGIFALLGLSLLFLALAAGQPARIHRWTEKWSEGIDIMLALDVSESMNADDFLPNRITVAKAVIRDFIQRRSNDRIGLVLFSGESFTLCPLTRDYDYLLSQVEDIRLSELKQGTAIGMGVTNSITRLRYTKATNRIVILLTDGDSNVGAINPITAAHLARQERIKIYTIGIGKKNRVVIPVYARDMYGRRTHLLAQIPSYLNPELLAEMAGLTGGKAYLARDPGMLAKILREIDSLEKTKVRSVPKEKREEQFWLPALIGSCVLFLMLFLQETRYRKAAVTAAGFRKRNRTKCEPSNGYPQPGRLIQLTTQRGTSHAVST